MVALSHLFIQLEERIVDTLEQIHHHLTVLTTLDQGLRLIQDIGLSCKRPLCLIGDGDSVCCGVLL